MDGGAAAREKNGANNLARKDRDSHVSYRFLNETRTKSKHRKKSPTGLSREPYAQKLARRHLTIEALSGTGTRTYLTLPLLAACVALVWGRVSAASGCDLRGGWHCGRVPLASPAMLL
jgi:hypothetical protein